MSRWLQTWQKFKLFSDGQCDFPNTWERTWFVNSVTEVEFTSLNTVITTENSVTGLFSVCFAGIFFTRTLVRISIILYQIYYFVQPNVLSNGTFSATSSCEDFHEPLDQWRYYVSTDSANSPDCYRVYQDSNLLVEMTGNYTGGNLLLSLLADQTITSGIL